MNDVDFLDYCQEHSFTERCGFVPEHVARLVKLAGMSDETIRYWESQPITVYELDRFSVRDAVAKARQQQAAGGQA